MLYSSPRQNLGSQRDITWCGHSHLEAIPLSGLESGRKGKSENRERREGVWYPGLSEGCEHRARPVCGGLSLGKGRV